MGIPTSEVGYTPAMPRREDHEVRKGPVVALETPPPIKKKNKEIKIAKCVLILGVAQLFYLFSFVCLHIIFSFVCGDYCTNTLPCFYHTLIVFMVHFTLLCF